VADRFDLRKDMEFETRVDTAVWDDTACRWTLTTSNGDTLSARYYIMASGCLSQSKLPEVPGVESFRGPTYHTGHWPHAGVDFTGLRVGVIGTGSSGIQSIPLIAEQAAQLTVFQRTPNFSIPAGNGRLGAAEIAEIKRDTRSIERLQFGVRIRSMPAPFRARGLEAERVRSRRVGQASWSLMLCFNDMITNRRERNGVRVRSQQNPFDRQEPANRRDSPMTIRSVPRPCLDTNYYATFNRSNVGLVNLRRTHRSDHADRHPHGGKDVHVRCARLCDLRRDRRIGRGRHQDLWRVAEENGQRRTYLGLTVWVSELSRSRAQQPVGLSNGCVDRTTRAVIDAALAHLRDHGKASIEASRSRGCGCSTTPKPAMQRSIRSRTPGTWAQRAGKREYVPYRRRRCSPSMITSWPTITGVS
jgi:cyclohexanone monooxygenase